MENRGRITKAIFYVLATVLSASLAIWIAAALVQVSLAQTAKDGNSGASAASAVSQPAPQTPPGLPPQNPPAGSSQSPGSPSQPSQSGSSDDSSANNGSFITSSSDGFLQIFNYKQAGRRDPFESPVTQIGPGLGPLLPLQRYDLDQLTLTAIIWNAPKPLALIKDPKGVVHFVSLNDKIGKNNGYVAVIRDGEIVVVEPTKEKGRATFKTSVLKLAQ